MQSSYHTRVVISHSGPDVKPSDCVIVLVSRSAIHVAIIFLESVSTTFIKFCLTVSILSVSRILSPGFVSESTYLISGFITSCSEVLVYCIKKPSILSAADADWSSSSVSLELVTSQRTKKTETTATIKNTSKTLLPTWNIISSAIRLFECAFFVFFPNKNPSFFIKYGNFILLLFS